jgi:hypothetical protein
MSQVNLVRPWDSAYLAAASKVILMFERTKARLKEWVSFEEWASKEIAAGLQREIDLEILRSLGVDVEKIKDNTNV